MEERLQRILAAAGVASRRASEALIASGRVAVDGRVVAELGTKADPAASVITVDGKPIGAAAAKLYILLNKPAGYTCTRSDPHARHTVIELIDGIDAFLYPVGRLDVDTSGLLILTNDGELAHALTHPSRGIEKTYRAVVRGRISAASLAKLESGVELDDGVTAPARARLISHAPRENTSTVEIVIHEGRKRQVRRVFATIGHRVQRLVRTRFAGLELAGLAEGRYRHLTRREVTRLARLAGRKEGEGRGRR